jgi:hypothetical protein
MGRQYYVARNFSSAGATDSGWIVGAFAVDHCLASWMRSISHRRSMRKSVPLRTPTHIEQKIALAKYDCDV